MLHDVHVELSFSAMHVRWGGQGSMQLTDCRDLRYAKYPRKSNKVGKRKRERDNGNEHDWGNGQWALCHCVFNASKSTWQHARVRLQSAPNAESPVRVMPSTAAHETRCTHALSLLGLDIDFTRPRCPISALLQPDFPLYGGHCRNLQLA